MGDVRVTAQNLEILEVHDEEGLILVKGSIPGAKNSYVILRDSVKIAAPANAVYPAKIKQSAKADAPKAENAPAAEAAPEAPKEGN
jgi:large subunit ribosomal protein L3